MFLFISRAAFSSAILIVLPPRLSIVSVIFIDLMIINTQRPSFINQSHPFCEDEETSCEDVHAGKRSMINENQLLLQINL